MKDDFHNNGRRLEHVLSAIDSSTEITPENRATIRDFYQHITLEEGLDSARQNRLMQLIKQVAIWAGPVPFKTSNKSDVNELILQAKNKKYTEWTQYTYIMAIKKFYKWLGKVDLVKDITVKKPSNPPEDLFSEDEIMKMITSCSSPRDKALISVLFESGGRIGEVGTLRIKDVKFNDQYVMVNFHESKTDKRQVPLVVSITYLRTWIEQHPFKTDPDSPLWVGLGSRCFKNPICYNALSKILKRAVRDAGIPKKIHAHKFRHSRASVDAQHLTEATMCQKYGWKQGSDMPGVYIHLNGRDLVGPILEMNGVIPKQVKKLAFAPKGCHNCGFEQNAPEAVFCSKCAALLTIGLAPNVLQEIDELKEQDRCLMAAKINGENDDEIRARISKIEHIIERVFGSEMKDGVGSG